MPVNHLGHTAGAASLAVSPINNDMGQTGTASTTLSSLQEVQQAETAMGVVKRPLVPIDYNTHRSISGFNSRVRFLVMHYTAADFKSSVNVLTKGAVSAHYLVPDPGDASYVSAGNTGAKIFNLVSESERAWHAGVSSWGGRNNLNDTSIGIENVNLAKDDGKGHFTFPPFHPEQINAIEQLAANIIQRYPDISPVNVVGHSDISIGRKSDPGPQFPWQRLAQSGVGAWYDEPTKDRYLTQFNLVMPSREALIDKFARYGYDTGKANTELGFHALTRAFQLHFRPQDYRGNIDPETAAILYALVEKYITKAGK